MILTMVCHGIRGIKLQEATFAPQVSKSALA